MSAPIPMGKTDEFVNIDIMHDVTASEGVIQTKSAVLEIIFELLCKNIDIEC
jgi:hypothetical protein